MLELLKVSVSKTRHLARRPSEQPASRSGEPVQLRQVIMNLITNASEALGNMEGVISISIATVTDQDSIADRPAAPARGDCVRLAISDTGCGMTQEILIQDLRSVLYDQVLWPRLGTGRRAGNHPQP